MANFFSGSHYFPTWRKAGVNESFCVRDVKVVKQNSKWASILVPKVGQVCFRLSRALPYKYGMARITLDRAGRWHVSFTSIPEGKDRVKTGNRVGIDRGVTNTLAMSSGQTLQVPTLPKLIAKQKSLQVTMSRQVKGSKRRAKTKAKLGLNYARITDRRNDWVEKTTTKLVENNDLIVFEKLNTRNMVKRPKAKENPDNLGSFLPNGAKAKAGLNRAILRSCWGKLEKRIEDKAKESKVTFIRVDPRYSSLECRRCSHIAKENRESQAVFKCVMCGHENNADINAAQVILARGLKVLASTPGPGACRSKTGARLSPPYVAARTSSSEAA